MVNTILKYRVLFREVPPPLYPLNFLCTGAEAGVHRKFCWSAQKILPECTENFAGVHRKFCRSAQKISLDSKSIPKGEERKGNSLTINP
jgi:hypothetical protein